MPPVDCDNYIISALGESSVQILVDLVIVLMVFNVVDVFHV